MIHKHDLRTAISDLRQALEHVEHYSGRPEVFCLKQLLVNPLSYLLTEYIVRAEQGESPVTSHNSVSPKCLCRVDGLDPVTKVAYIEISSECPFHASALRA